MKSIVTDSIVLFTGDTQFDIIFIIIKKVSFISSTYFCDIK